MTFLSTREVCDLIGVTRAALYQWDAEPDFKAPGDKGTLGWTFDTARRLAHDHGRHHLCPEGASCQT